MNIPVVKENHTAAAARLPAARLLIGERFVEQASGGAYAHVNPSTGAVQVEVPMAGAREVDLAVQAARKGFAAWQALPPHERRTRLLRFAELSSSPAYMKELETLRPLESGMTAAYISAHEKIIREWSTYYAGWADKIEGAVVAQPPVENLQYLVPEAYGVIAIIIPWNAPELSLAMKVPAALAAGNAVVVKPPEQTPFSALRYGELALEAGIPPGVVNIVPGGAEAGDALVRHPGVDKISFTGGLHTARRIMAAAADTLTPVLFELGGKSANLVFADADLAHAIPFSAAFGCTANAGQGCALATRLLVEDSIYDRVLEGIAETVQKTAVGDPLDLRTGMGPLYAEAHFQRVLGIVERAGKSGSGRLVCGGRRLGDSFADGYFLEPTVFADVDPDSEIWQQEIFGPVLCVQRFKTEAEAIALANGTQWGLSSYIQTSNLGRAHRVAAALRAGNAMINGASLCHYSATFGGVGASGIGTEGGKPGLQEMFRYKTVGVRC